MFNQIVWFLTSGRTRVLKSLIASVLACFGFSCAPAIWMYPEVNLPPAYQVKSESPLADTATLTIPAHEGERSHGAKLTPRLLSSCFLYAATSIGQHPYVPATIGGLFFLLAGVLTGSKLGGSPLMGLFTGLLFAGLYASNACFSMNHGPKPFDGIAIGMVAVTLIMIDRPVLFAASAYLSCWTDERALVSLFLIGALIMVRESLDANARQLRYLILVGAVMTYGLSRLIAGRILGWTDGDTSMLGDNLLASFSYGQMVAWTCFEGGWLLIGSAIWLSVKANVKKDAIILLVATAIAMASCLVVLDLSRAAAFSFPTLLIAIVVMQKHSSFARNLTPRTTALAATVSLLASNVEIISSIAFTPLPTTPIVMWLKWIN